MKKRIFLLALSFELIIIIATSVLNAKSMPEIPDIISKNKINYKTALKLHNDGKYLDAYNQFTNIINGNDEALIRDYVIYYGAKSAFYCEMFEEAIDLYRLVVDTRFTCKKELYNLLKKDNYKFLGDYYFEMGYLVCNQTVKPKTTDGKCVLATEDDKDILINFIYNESREISDIKELSLEEAKDNVEKKLNMGTYYVWKNNKEEIVAQASYKILAGNAKITGVYTLPEERGKRYAANLIYNLTSKVLEEGNHVSLYTDYNYIPSNKAYKNVGYVTEDILINFSCIKK